MNFDLTEDEEMLKALAERFVADRYDGDQRRRWQGEAWGFARDNWALLGELGLIAALLDAKQGGLGIGPVGLMTVFEALGHGLVVEPLIENVAVAAPLLLGLASPELGSQWQADLAAGTRRLALAHRERAARRNLDWVECAARRGGGGVKLSGAKSLVPAGLGVDGYLVSARQEGGAVGLFLVEAGSPGLTVQSWRLIDGSVAARLDLADVAVPPKHCLGSVDDALAAIAAAYDRAALLYSAEALGIMERLHAETLEYLRTRKQFGVTLGSFQTLQHRMVMHYAAIAQGRGLLIRAALAEGAARQGAVHGARAFIVEAGVALGHEAIQLHGGMGMTDELSVSHAHKRLLLISRWPEDAEVALDRYAAASQFPA